MEKQLSKSKIKNGAAELAPLTSDATETQERIEAARLNAAKVQELMKTHDDYPSEVGTLI